MSCDCESSRKGYFWRSRDNICEDINECEDQSICPLGKHCVNTEGGYQCICPPGTTENPRTTACEAVSTKSENKASRQKGSLTQHSSSESDTIAHPADFSGSKFVKGSASPGNPGLRPPKGPSSDMTNHRPIHTETQANSGNPTNIGPSAKPEMEAVQVTAAVSEQRPPFRTQAENSGFKSPTSNDRYSDFSVPNSETVFDRPDKPFFPGGDGISAGQSNARTGEVNRAQPNERNNPAVVINNDFHSSAGKFGSQGQKKRWQPRNELDKRKNVNERSQEDVEKDKPGTFLSGFMGLISGGTRNVPSSQMFIFGHVCFLICQRLLVNLF